MVRYKKDGYGYLINTCIVIGEFILLNLLFYVTLKISDDFLVKEVLKQKRLLFFALNVGYLPALFIRYRKFHEQRIVFVHSLIQHTFEISVIFFLTFSTLLIILKIEDLSRFFLFSFCATFFFVLSAWWLLAWCCLKIYRKAGYNFKNVLFVGGGDNIQLLTSNLLSEDNYGYRIVGCFAQKAPDFLPSSLYLGSQEQVFCYLETHNVDELYCSLDDNNMETIINLSNYCDNRFIRFFYVPALTPLLARHMKMEMIGSSPVMANRQEPLNNFFSRLLKRSFDILLSGVMLILSPLWFIPIAIAVKLSSPGPVLFKQLRTGEEGKDFWCYKFRSMRMNSDSDKLQATRDDPRKTKVGDFLRRTNLDEFPQFINIFKGDMSVVGPRPHMLKHTEDYSHLIDKYMVRHYVKPGLTGWAQVNGYRGETKENWQMAKRVEFDIWYLENWSFWLDLKIIAQTGYKMFKHDENAF